MKLKTSLLLCFASITFLSNAQQVKRCASYEYLKSIDQKYPGTEQYVKDLPNQISNDNHKKTRAATITIPVVVHIVYNTGAENLTDDYVHAQIDLLNKSFLRKNADTSSLRSEFLPVVGPANIQFMLSQIIRKSTATTAFVYDFDFNNNNIADYVKQTSNGGDDAISPDRKLNIWVCDIDVPGAAYVLLGYAYPPTGLPNWGPQQYPTGQALDGVVIDYLAFGGPNKLPKGNAAYGCTGKTTVHEVGHYLGLRHTWGDDNGKCAGQNGYEDDGIADTPDQASESNSDCNKIKNTCNQGAGDKKDMVENYMDYSAESCQNSFTKGQVTLMESVLNNQRLLVRIPTKIEDYDFSANVTVYPNPTDNIINIGITNLDFQQASVFLMNNLGQIVKTTSLNQQTSSTSLHVENLPTGIYFLKIVLDNEYTYNQKVVVE
ncbi:MAG TPA: zinc-dependent metalloprotease [Chitinophagaceae bacterium]|jgi:hypothetical protein|nr:zinc-dependent metalloprotease [Chitinophagaceae bacterium]